MKTGATVVGSDIYVSGNLLHHVDENQRILILGADNHIGFDPMLREPFDLRIDGGRPDAAGDEQYLPRTQRFDIFVHEIRRPAQRAREIGQFVARIHSAQLRRRITHRLRYDGYPPLRRIVIGDGQRDTFPLFVQSQDDELPRLCRTGDTRSRNVHPVNIGREQLLFNDFIHFCLFGLGLYLPI